MKGKDEFLKGTTTEKLKVYALLDAKKEVTEVLLAYKCPTNPATYIHVSFHNKDKDRPIYRVIYEIKRPRPTFERVMFQLFAVVDIVEGKYVVGNTSMELNLNGQLNINA